MSETTSNDILNETLENARQAAEVAAEVASEGVAQVASEEAVEVPEEAVEDSGKDVESAGEDLAGEAAEVYEEAVEVAEEAEVVDNAEAAKADEEVTESIEEAAVSAETVGEDLQEAPREILVQISGADIVNDGNVILSNVDIEIAKGEFVYLLGKVGSGKSSIIKTLIAELPLKKGKASIAGFDLWKIKKRNIPYLRRKLGVVFQDFQLLMDRSVEDNLLFVLEATGWKRRKEMLARAKEVLQMVGLPEKAGKMPHQLSGGEQQRVAIARALLNNPQVILADEPTGNLDEETASEIMNLLCGIHAQQQTAVLMVTHNRELFKRFPGRVLICESGTVREMEQEIDFFV